MRHARGNWVWLRARCELVRQAGEPHPHLIGIAVDITEQKRLAEESATAEMRLSDAIEAISEAFVVWDADNRLVLCNSKFQSLHGLTDEAVAPGDALRGHLGGRQQADRAHATVQRGARGSRRAHLRGAARRRPLAADQRAAHQGRRLRLGRHQHHRAQAARGEADREREAAEGDRRRPALLAAGAGAPDRAARLSGRALRRAEGPRRGGQPGEVGVPRQHEPRAAHAAQRHHRILRDDGIGTVRPARRREISSNTAATSARAGAICSTSSTTFSTCRRSRPGARPSSPRRSSSTPSSPTSCGWSRRARTRSGSTIKAEIEPVDPAARRPAHGQADRDQSAVQRGEIHRRTAGASRCARASSTATSTSRSRTPASASRKSALKNLGKPFEQVESQFTKTHRGSGLGLAIAKSLTELHGGAMRIRSSLGVGTIVLVRLPVGCRDRGRSRRAS